MATQSNKWYRTSRPDRMNILVTNDDGIDSVGLHEVARELAALGFVTICAPDREYSGSSVAIGSIHQLRPTVKRESVHGVGEAWSVDGPPALCVMLALSNMFERKFDLIPARTPGGTCTTREPSAPLSSVVLMAFRVLRLANHRRQHRGLVRQRPRTLRTSCGRALR
jgi:hypothetical protein